MAAAPMPIPFGTIVARRHLPSAQVLARSLAEHHPELELTVVVTDGDATDAPAGTRGLSLRDLPIPHPDRFCFANGEPARSYAATPYLLRELLGRGAGAAGFIKQESLVVGDLSAAVAEIRAHPITVTAHLLEPRGAERELAILRSGIFNVGLVGVSDRPEAHALLDWWSDRTYLHCRHDVAAGMHYEQRWLDLAQGFFDLNIVRDPGCNVGHWNLPERLDCAGRWSLLRFSGFDPERPGRPSRHSDRLERSALGDAGAWFERYGRELLAAGWREALAIPYGHAAFDNDVPIPAAARALYAELGAPGHFGDPFAAQAQQSFFRWLTAPLPGESWLTPLWRHVHRMRPDVRAAHPDASSPGFRDWAARSGLGEHEIDAAFLP